MPKTTSKMLGLVGENLAQCYLALRGYQILHTNYTCPLGEIDLIAKEGEYLVFVEVKARGSDALGMPAEAVTSHKQRQITKTALYYLKRFGDRDLPCRFDVVSVLFQREKLPLIDLIKNAF